MRQSLKIVAVIAAFAVASGVYAQEKKEEEPFWAKGKPKEGPGAAMAPVAAPPVPVAADKLPKLKAPAGFKVEVYQSGILDARGLRRSDKGTVFVSSLFVAGKVYAITEKGGKREVKTVLTGLELPSGIALHKGALYVATPKKIMRYDNIEDNLDKAPEPVVIYDKLPGEIPHGWKYLRFGPDNKLYVPVGTPCNICTVDQEKYDQIFRINADGSGREIVARGVRNTVGFDFHPKTKELWFTDNQRDWLSEDFPLDELNRLKNPGKDHFGYPYCHSGTMADPEFGWGKSCADFVKPAALLGPHAAPLGMTFYTGKAFPTKYRGAIFIARHGPWNRTKKDADVAVAYLDGNSRVTRVEPFLTGFVKDNQYEGRPVDLLTLPDGSMLVSDDHAGAIYRVSYGK
jgi:glucose/arabinose dehydrogenase